jgi:YebC/PmpR family DNA-binding regulatory protein
MSGHSKWHTIKHKKGAADAKRGKIFTRIIKELTIAARNGGGDPDMNPRLRTVIAEAKQHNMPADNIKRAIQRGTGELEGANYDELTYEGYGPGGVAVLVEVFTDNRNRTVAEVRHAFNKNKGNLGEAGCVGWLFQAKGYVAVPKGAADEERIMEAALDAGAEDVKDAEDQWEVTTAPSDFYTVREAIEKAGLPVDSSSLTKIPGNTVKVEGKEAEQMLRLIEMLEDNDDVQNVYANFDISESEMERLAQLG